jgi:hypothetical protein
MFVRLAVKGKRVKALKGKKSVLNAAEAVVVGAKGRVGVEAVVHPTLALKTEPRTAPKQPV